MQRRDLLTLVIAVSAALIAFFLVLNMLNKPSAPVAPRFVMALQDLAEGTTLSAEMIGLSGPAPDKDPTQFFLQTQDVIGMRAAEPVASGSIIARSQLRPAPSQREEALSQIPTGMSAVKVSFVSLEMMPELADVGSYVDVLGHIAGQNAADLRPLYRAAKIIALQQKDPKLGTDGHILLAVTMEGAELLARAMVSGKLSLILRTDEEPVGGVVVGGTELSGTQPAPTVEIIRGVIKERSVVDAAASSPPAGVSAGVDAT